MSEEAQGVDLSTYLSILDRNQLEFLLVKAIMKDESNFDDMVSVCSTLDEVQLLEDIEQLQTSVSDDPTNYTLALTPFFDRSAAMTSIDFHEGAIKVLYMASNQFICDLIEGTCDELETEEINNIISTIENAWKNTLTTYTPPTPEEIKEKEEKKLAKKDENEDDEVDVTVPAPSSFDDIFKTLAKWRVELQPKYGPLFSEPLRVLKATMKKSGGLKLTKTEDADGNKKRKAKSDSTNQGKRNRKN